jgi:hypothetical protein
MGGLHSTKVTARELRLQELRRGNFLFGSLVPGSGQEAAAFLWAHTLTRSFSEFQMWGVGVGVDGGSGGTFYCSQLGTDRLLTDIGCLVSKFVDFLKLHVNVMPFSFTLLNILSTRKICPSYILLSLEHILV